MRGPVVVIAGSRDQLRRVPRNRHDRTEVVELVGYDDADLHDRLAALPAIGMVVDVRRAAGQRQLATWRELFLHLDPGAAWVALRSPDGHGQQKLIARATRAVDRSSAPDGERTALDDAIASVSVDDRFVVVVKAQQHLLKIRDRQAPLLATREPDLRVTEVHALPAGEFTPAGTTTSYSGHDPGFDDVIRYPRLQVTRYDGRVVLPRATLMYHGRSVLPDSYRWHLTESPKVNGLVDVRGHFGLPRDTEEPEDLPGSYYQFGYNNPGHFGHLMTEALARLWGWEHAKAADPDLKILCRVHPDPHRARPERRLESRLLPAFGIDPDDIVWVDRPVRVERVVSATPMWHNAAPYYAHPGIREVWRRLRAGLPDAPVPLPDPTRIFVTRPVDPDRRSWNRECHNHAEVEALFAEHGFTVVQPAELSLPEQAALFAHAEVIAGFGGSAMFNMVYAERVREVIVLNHSGYVARNEHLFASLHDASSHWFWSDPDIAHPEGGFDQRAFQSPWTFDRERNEADLRRLLERLGG